MVGRAGWKQARRVNFVGAEQQGLTVDDDRLRRADVKHGCEVLWVRVGVLAVDQHCARSNVEDGRVWGAGGRRAGRLTV